MLSILRTSYTHSRHQNNSDQLAPNKEVLRAFLSPEKDIPTLSILCDIFPWFQVCSLVVAGALGDRHTGIMVVQVGIVGAATAIHRREILWAILFSISQGAAGLLAQGQVVKEDLVSWAGRNFTSWRRRTKKPGK